MIVDLTGVASAGRVRLEIAHHAFAPGNGVVPGTLPNIHCNHSSIIDIQRRNLQSSLDVEINGALALDEESVLAALDDRARDDVARIVDIDGMAEQDATKSQSPLI